MKKTLSFCCIFLTLAVAARADVLIRGHIKDSLHQKVTIFEPIDGFSNRTINRPEFATALGQDGYFEKKIPVDFPVMISINIGINPIWVFVEPGDTVTVEADHGILIGGKNGAGNTFYNQFNASPIKKFQRFEHLLDSLGFRKTLDLSAVDYALSAVVRPFDSLLAAGKITKTFYDIVVSDTRNILLTHVTRFAFHDSAVSSGQALDIFDQVYARYPLTERVIRGGLYGAIPCYAYYYIKGRKAFPDAHDADSILLVHGKKVFVNSNLVAYLFAPDDLKEPLWAFTLMALNKLFADEFGARDVETFLTLFPDSKLRPYLAPPYYNLAAGPQTFGDSSAFIFAAADHINSFDSLLTQFRGKRLLVDLWATWCVPCKMEFASNAPVDSFCRRHDIERLYVAFEQGPTRKSVRRDVYAYNLKGVHVIANDTLIKDMTLQIYAPEKGYSIPHYLLIDEKGDLLDKDAPRPSSADALFARMKAVFKLE